MWYKNIAGRFFELVTKHACNRRTEGQTDGQMDRQNYDSQDSASIAASRGKNRQAYQLWLATSATRCITANVLQTKLDAQCDKLATELS